MHRVAKHGAKLLLRLPAHDPAKAEGALLEQCRRGNWRIERIMQVLAGELRDNIDDNLRDRIRTNGDLVRETIIHARAVKRPGYAQVPAPDRPPAEIVFSPIDMHAAFERV